MRNILRACARALACCAILGATALAQPAPPSNPLADQTKTLDSARANLDQIEQTLTRADLGDAELQDLRARLDPLAAAAQAAIVQLQPQLDAAKARIDQLGPKPGASAPPEAPDVAAERADQQKNYETIDALLKRAALMSTQIQQDGDAIATRRSELFTRALFARTSSLANPRFWLGVIQEVPRDWRATTTVAGDWFGNMGSKLADGNGALLAAALATIALACFFVSRVSRRVGLRDPAIHDPTPMRLIVAACWGALVEVATPIAAAATILGLLRSFELFNDRMEPLAVAMFDAALRIAVALGIARALLAPGLPNWRPLRLSDKTASRLFRLALIIAATMSAFKILEAIAEIIGASLRTSIALRGVSALAVAGLAGSGLRRLSTQEQAEEEDCLPPRLGLVAHWATPARAAGWVVVAAIAAAPLLGYTAFAAFLADQAAWVVFLGATLYLLLDLSHEAATTGFQPSAPFGRAAIAGLGLGRDSLAQFGVLASGLLTVALAVVAAMLALAPWGLQSDDILGGVRAAFFGFKVGETTISLSSLLLSFALFGVAWAASRGVQNWLEKSFLPQTKLDSGLRNSIRVSVGYIGFLLAAAIGLGNLGLSFDKIAIVAGALSVGIGFGLQSIVNNFVSGLILLWERAIRVGDWVVVGDEQGYVRRINIRSTEIETFDRAVMIVPNSNLVAGVVKNWVRNDRVGRVRAQIAVAAETDPEIVRGILLGCAAEHELVLKIPKPLVWFMAIADNALKFDLVCFVSDVEMSTTIRSDLYYEILKRLKAAGVGLFSSATQIALTDAARIEAMLAARDRRDSGQAG